MNTKTAFVPGTVYYGTLTCAHSDFPVRCVRRTEKSVWFEHVTHPDVYGTGRTKTTGGDFDPLTI